MTYICNIYEGKLVMLCYFICILCTFIAKRAEMVHAAEVEQVRVDQEMQALLKQEEAAAKAARVLAQEERGRCAAVARKEARRVLKEDKELEAEEERSISTLTVWTMTLASSVQREASTAEEKDAQKQASDALERTQAELQRLAAQQVFPCRECSHPNVFGFVCAWTKILLNCALSLSHSAGTLSPSLSFTFYILFLLSFLKTTY